MFKLARSIVPRTLSYSSAFKRVDFRLFSFRKNENKIEQAQRHSQNIPDASYDARIINWLSGKNSIGLIQTYLKTQQLRQLQKNFYARVHDPKQAYFYFKELNRQGKYATVVRLFGEYKGLFMNPGITTSSGGGGSAGGSGELADEVESHMYVQQVSEQFQIAEQGLQSQSRTAQLAGALGGKRTRWERLRLAFAYLLFFLLISELPLNFSIDVEQDNDGDDTDSAQQ